jgi:hypothetical protein
MKRLPQPLSTKAGSLAIPYEHYAGQASRRKRELTDGHPGSRSAAQSGAARFKFIAWMVSGLVAIFGLVRAAHSEQPLLWLAVWPAPVTLAYTVFIFLRQGFHFEDGVLVLGRRRD